MPRLLKRYTGAPDQRARFDDLTKIFERTSLPGFSGTVEGDSIRVTVSLSDPVAKTEWQDAGHPDDVSGRFDDWLKKNGITPSIP